MASEFLDAEDYASVERAARVLSGGRTLNACTEDWAQLVESVEQGFDTRWAFEFDDEVWARTGLGNAWPILTERVRRIRQPELDALDERFRAASAPMLGMSEESVALQERWWQYRYPLRVTGDPGGELPHTWSPAPVNLG